MKFNKQKIVAIVGPTGSGKTSLSIALAKKFHGEIVSADSRQIYRDMNIGTAKALIDSQSAIAAAQLPITSSGIPHYLVDIKNPNEDYSVADFKRDAEIAIAEIAKKGSLPMLVGGTGLYVWAVIDNLDIPETKADPALRARIEREIQENGLSAVFNELVALDPEAAYIVDPKNPRRIVRALEVAITTGKPFTTQRMKKESPYDALKLGINPPPEILRERINLRIDAMMRDGLLNEVQNLIKTYGDTCIAFDAIGYREIISHLQGKISLDESVNLMKNDTWHYAKRQMTWFKRDKEIHWINDVDEAEKLVKKFVGE